MKTFEHLGLQCVELANDWVTLWVTQSVGPRVILLKANGGENLFASLPDTILECPGKGSFHLYGGHRLWYAPEEPRRTYLPDDSPVEIAPIENGFHVSQEIEAETGIRKSLRIQLVPDSPKVVVEHFLTNDGLEPVTCAPWAITQMKPGGVAILPQNQGLMDDNPTLPNRAITLWPYTQINTPYITWGDAFIQVRAEMTAGMLKIGFPNPRGWLAYWIDDTLFVKRAAYDPERKYYDFGSSSECYCNEQFLEMETLGPITMLKPGEFVKHNETWEVITNLPWPKDIQDIFGVLQ